MFIKRKNKEIPELNTVSTADISFMLLIFFLVTTSINTEKGLKRMLPRAEKEQKNTLTEVQKNKLLALSLTPNNQVVVNNAIIPIDSIYVLASQVIEYAKEQHIIKLETHPKATYQAYFKVQEQLTKAYETAKNKEALKRYQRIYNECSEEEKQSISIHFPWRVQEVTTQEQKGNQL